MTGPYVDPLHQAGGHIETLDRVIAVPSPALGVDASVTVPGHEVWEILSGSVVLTTGAGVANRIPTLVVDDQSSTYFAVGLGATLVASTTQRFAFAHLGFIPPVVAGAPVMVPFVDRLILGGGHRFRFSTIALDPSDQWSQFALFVRVRTNRGLGAQLAYDQQFAVGLAEAAVVDPLLG